MLMISKKIVIVGTHATPALALIEALKKREEWQIYYLGRRYTFEGKKFLPLKVKFSLSIIFLLLLFPAGDYSENLLAGQSPRYLKFLFPFWSACISS